jgi:Uma2 family endonuclease
MEAIAAKPKRAAHRKVPEWLICEVLDGRPLYYRDYKKVISKKKTLEDIMGSSTLQFIILDYLLSIFYKFLDRDKLFIGNNEAGIHLGLHDNLSTDIAIFEKSVLTPAKISTGYADVPPKLVVEVDTNIEFEGITNQDYIHLKTQKLLDFGTEKVLWIFTSTKKVMVATQQQPWLTYDWNRDLDLWEGQNFNIGNYLGSEGIKLD